MILYNFFYDEDVQVLKYVASQKSQLYMALLTDLWFGFGWKSYTTPDINTWSTRSFQRFADTDLNSEAAVVDMVNETKFVWLGDALASSNNESDVVHCVCVI